MLPYVHLSSVGRKFADHITGQNNAYLVKRKTSGGVQFSRDPYNLTNKHSRKVGDGKHIIIAQADREPSMMASSTTR